MPFHHSQPTFAGGEITPAAWARTDLAKYGTGLRTARNITILAQGGARNRPGTKFVATAKDSANPVRLIPFTYSTNQAYVLEFGHLYIRFYTADARIEVATVPVEVASPYLGSELADVKFVQSADVLYIVHPLHAPQKLTRLSNVSWTLTTVNFTRGPFMLQNTDKAKVKDITVPAWVTGLTYPRGEMVSNPLGGPLYISLVTHVAGVFATDLAAGLWLLIPIVATTAGGVTIDIIGDPLTAGNVGSLFEFVQTVDAQSVSQSFTATGQTSAVFRSGHSYQIVTNGAWAGSILIEKSLDGGLTWIVLRKLISNGTDNYSTSGDTGEDQCLLRLRSATDNTTGVWAGTASVSITSSSFDWKGVVKILTVNGPGTQATVSIEVALGSSQELYTWSEGSWSTRRGFPTCCTFYQDRLALASTVTEPQTVWLSQTASYEDFGVSSPLVDSDAISIVLPSRSVNIVKSMVALGSLIALTSDAEFSIAPGQSGVLSPTSLDVQCQSHRGSASIDPALIGNEIILIQQMGTIVRNMVFQLAVGGYEGENISVISQHLFTGYTIKALAFAQEPDSIVWAVRSDGVLLSLTYLREQEVRAWTHQDTDGLFESVVAIPNPVLGLNETWFVINRAGVRIIERLMPRDQGTVPANQFFVDSGLSYDGAPATTFTGLAHLNGKQVSILADGNVISSPRDPSYPVITVAAGQITIPVAASKVAVGLPYISDVETLRIETPAQDGTTQGRRMKIPRGKIRFWDSRGGWFRALGNSSDPVSLTSLAGFDPIKQREPGDNLNAAIPLKTRDYAVSFASGYDHGAHLFLRQVDPLPITLLAFMPIVVTGGE